MSTGEVKKWHFGEVACALSLTTNPKWMLVALGSRVILWDPLADKRVHLSRPEPNWPMNRLNDGASDPNGFFWVGSTRNDVTADGGHIEISGNHGSLYRVAPDGQVKTLDVGFGITNTVVWSPNGTTFYCGCSLSNVIYAYDFDRYDSSIRNRRIFSSGLMHGIPDGSAVDVEGYLWNCRYFGGCILRISPAGTVERVINFPVSNITHCCFGGQDMRTLYVTTAALQAQNEELAGGLFGLTTDIPGIPMGCFHFSESVLVSAQGKKIQVVSAQE